MSEGVARIEYALKRYEGCRGQSEYNELEDAVRGLLETLLNQLDGDRIEGAVTVARRILGNDAEGSR